MIQIQHPENLTICDHMLDHSTQISRKDCDLIHQDMVSLEMYHERFEKSVMTAFILYMKAIVLP